MNNPGASFEVSLFGNAVTSRVNLPPPSTKQASLVLNPGVLATAPTSFLSVPHSSLLLIQNIQATTGHSLSSIHFSTTQTFNARIQDPAPIFWYPYQVIFCLVYTVSGYAIFHITVILPKYLPTFTHGQAHGTLLDY